LGGLLDNARKFFQGLASAPPVRVQRFSVACPEGHRLSGSRTEGYQSLRCPTCGEGIFVLPRSLLPEQIAPAVSSPTSGRRRPERPEALPDEDSPVELTDPETVAATGEDPADGEVEWIDETPEAEVAPVKNPSEFRVRPADLAGEESPSKPRRRPRRGASGTRKSVAEGPSGSDSGVRETVETPHLPTSAADWVRKRRNVLVTVAVLLVVLGTWALRSWRSRRQELPRIAELGRVEGLPALDEGRFDRAHQLLAEANRAVIELGDAYQGAAAIRQGADEAAVITRLGPERLETLLDEAARADPVEWPKRFDSLYKGRSIIVDSFVTSVPDGLGAGHYALDYPIVPDGGDGGPPRSVGRIDTTGFRLLDLIKPKVGDRIAFGARLASFRFDAQGEMWLVGLEKDSGVIMTHTKALDALAPGWSFSADPSTEDAP